MMSNQNEILHLSASQISASVTKGELSAVQVTEAFLNQSKLLNQKLNALISIDERSLDRAKALDKKIQDKKFVGKLVGVPICLKDMFCTKGLRTTAASKILSNFIPPYSATVTERLEREGAIIISKANQDEFAMGSSNENSAFGPVKNPWNLEKVPGGSSGGSAAAVSALMAPVAFGTDTGGSIRQPANFCGVVGLKPTYGRISRYGIIAFASSLDQAGPMTKTVRDAAISLESVAGVCEMDGTSSSRPVPKFGELLTSNVKGLRIGKPRSFFAQGLSQDTAKVIDNSFNILKDNGAIIVDLDIDHLDLSVPVYYIIATCEASSNLARYDGVRYGMRSDFSKALPDNLADFYSRTRGEFFGEEVKRRIILGTYALSSGYYDAYYKKAGQVRRLVRDGFLKAFEKCDVLLTPVTTQSAFGLGEKNKNPIEMYLNDIFTISTNLAGLPGLSVPGGLDTSGLPVGIQLIGKPFDEQTILNVAQCMEENVTISEVPSVLR